MIINLEIFRMLSKCLITSLLCLYFALYFISYCIIIDCNKQLISENIIYFDPFFIDFLYLRRDIDYAYLQRTYSPFFRPCFK